MERRWGSRSPRQTRHWQSYDAAVNSSWSWESHGDGNDHHESDLPDPWYIDAQDLVLEPAGTSKHRYTLVLLHSCSGGPDDWLPYVHRLNLPFRSSIRIVVPCAPVRHESHGHWNGKQNSWFEYSSEGDTAKNADQLAEQRERLLALVHRERERLPDQDGRRLILGGLSQGVALAVDVALRTPFSIGGVLALRGMVLRDSLSGLGTVNPFELFVYHGERDWQCPVAEAKAGYESLRAHGVSLEFWSDPALGHACARGRQRLCGLELRRVCAFLRRMWSDI
eukprot:TRINITY_DN37564_c0_g1_i1.p2 TRINITY_DN37564_c0_g1~~TRINITY_DN37564_c0_g1_i1.p2  ORF type:complete len:280 (-),score=32.60 TRINITY_DN37564_c0_g1_i1:8-847(-)